MYKQLNVPRVGRPIPRIELSKILSANRQMLPFVRHREGDLHVNDTLKGAVTLAEIVIGSALRTFAGESM
jgi:hypothetical protein